MTPDEALDRLKSTYHSPLLGVVREELERLRSEVAAAQDSVSFNAYRALEADLAAARALLLEARSSATHVRVMSRDLCGRIDAFLAGKGAT